MKIKLIICFVFTCLDYVSITASGEPATPKTVLPWLGRSRESFSTLREKKDISIPATDYNPANDIKYASFPQPAGHSPVFDGENRPICYVCYKISLQRNVPMLQKTLVLSTL